MVASAIAAGCVAACAFGPSTTFGLGTRCSYRNSPTVWYARAVIFPAMLPQAAFELGSALSRSRFGNVGGPVHDPRLAARTSVAADRLRTVSGGAPRSLRQRRRVEREPGQAWVDHETRYLAPRAPACVRRRAAAPARYRSRVKGRSRGCPGCCLSPRRS